jgi:hypothetical protein
MQPRSATGAARGRGGGRALPARRPPGAALPLLLLLLAAAVAARGPPAAPPPPERELPAGVRVEGDGAAFVAAAAAASAAGPTGSVTITYSNGSAVGNISCPIVSGVFSTPLRITVTGGPGAVSACVRVFSYAGGWFGSCSKAVAACPAALVANGSSASFNFWPCSSWQGVVTAQAVFLSAGGTAGPAAVDSTVIDCVPPSMKGMRIRTASDPTSSAASLYWTGQPSAQGAPLAGYTLAYRAKRAPPARCRAASGVTLLPVPPGAGASAAAPFNLSGLAADTTYRVRLCAYDEAGNVAGGVTAKVQTAP